MQLHPDTGTLGGDVEVDPISGQANVVDFAKGEPWLEDHVQRDASVCLGEAEGKVPVVVPTVQLDARIPHPQVSHRKGFESGRGRDFAGVRVSEQGAQGEASPGGLGPRSELSLDPASHQPGRLQGGVRAGM
ncbi:MAG: hypothetical protein EA351_09040 [Gemmatimonadales bacterium]|nr:MAG: hypothetical protein EA351_09040 [Gemmatimonadales bacterium]